MYHSFNYLKINKNIQLLRKQKILKLKQTDKISQKKLQYNLETFLRPHKVMRIFKNGKTEGGAEGVSSLRARLSFYNRV